MEQEKWFVDSAEFAIIWGSKYCLVSSVPSSCQRLIQRYTVETLAPVYLEILLADVPFSHIHTITRRSAMAVRL
ncbi:hypothetical protein Pcinc_001273 [Petrolisthes cinctipes]|uniref:Uncharacterized protein n=1 Tax=Petrolisthes cinctipes TaxID=88211 RepID=A0AAE1KZ05_PETCI|nr:hypothetical protein Pcinc_016758 [Petrolisthes cinctipes]KAK3888997.1 hypothetical protein Pcinc_006968 [Petrolisthes cinctipes]KAK3894980.1 hypothetical protein Pcinc_001273 [Petrolisthes cinctipes]